MEDNKVMDEIKLGSEALKFAVNKKNYAVGVDCVKEILPLSFLTPVPNANPAVIGMTLIRGDVVVVVDLHTVLEGYASNRDGFDNIKILLCEIRDNKLAFCVDQVVGIHRIAEGEIHKPDKLVKTKGLIANLEYEGTIYMMLDFEELISEF